MKKIILLITCFVQLSVFAQLPDGSTAPDFTLTDYYGTEHNLYAYLDAGKTVYVEIFAAHCPACWNYHQSHTLKNLYNDYGPDGTDEVMVLALEYDQYNDSNAFTGNHEPWVTQGNWLEGTPYPIFNVEDPDRGVFEDYDVSFYPVIYKVCPDRLLERVMISQDETELYQQVLDCQSVLSVDEAIDLGAVYVIAESNTLFVAQYESVIGIEMINIHGQLVSRTGAMSQSNMVIEDVQPGIYLFHIRTAKGTVAYKLWLE